MSNKYIINRSKVKGHATLTSLDDLIKQQKESLYLGYELYKCWKKFSSAAPTSYLARNQ